MANQICSKLILSTGLLLLATQGFASTPSSTSSTDSSSTTSSNSSNTSTGSTDTSTVRGPDPSASFLEANRGPYSVGTISLSRYSVSGFGGGTVHYPTNASGKMGAIAVVPGYISYESSIKWWGPKLASHGFVVITIDTNSGYDQPDSRANQLSAALDQLVSMSTSSTAIAGKVDANRLAVIGWSMGGGGALKLSTQRNLKAAIPQAPWYSGSSQFRSISVPTMIIACESDTIAPVYSHASPFYTAIPSSTPKAFLEVRNGSHYCANSGYNESVLGKYGVSWMKRFVDGDTRYSQFLCGPYHTADYSISAYRDTCSY